LERLEFFGRAFGLGAREDELLGLLATGCDTRSMARQMSLSEHNIQDYLTSICHQDLRLRSRNWSCLPHSASGLRTTDERERARRY
jgi:DNA-binding NarL/FixJ family response regulator